jgi:hypothetical protein
MDNESGQLSDALRAIAREDPGRASPRVEARLRAEFQAARGERRPGNAAFGFGMAMVAALVTAVAVPAWKVLVRERLRWPSPPSSTVSRSSPTPGRATVTTAFLPLTYSALPATDAQIVRLEVPRAVLASFGLAPIEVGETEPAGRSGTVSADVLIGEDGLARAVRFVRAPGHGPTTLGKSTGGKR